MSLIQIFFIVFIQLFLLFIYHFMTKKGNNKNDLFKDKLELINSIFKNTKHDKITLLEEIKKIELKADEMTIFSQDIYRDVKDNGQFSNTMYTIGTFYDIVAENLKSKKDKKYNYFIKRDANFKHSIISFFKSHDSNHTQEKAKFIIIPSDKYHFYDEVYLYEYRDKSIKPKAFEFLPSISNEKEQILYYIELDENQIARLLKIKDNLQKKYGENSEKDIKEIHEKIDEFSNI